MAFFDEEEYQRPFDIKIWKKLMPFIRRYYGLLTAVFSLMLLAAFMDVLMPLFQRYAIDNFITPGTTEGLLPFAAIFAVGVTMQAAIVIVFVQLAIRIEMLLGRDCKRACFVHLQTLSLSYYNTTPVGYILSRVMSDTNRIGGLVAWGLVDGMWAFSYVTGVFIAMLLLNRNLALIIMAVVPVIAVITWYFQNKILQCNREVRRENSRITGAFNEGITGARTSKTLVIEEANSQSFGKISGRMYNSSMRAARLNALYVPIISFFSSLATAIVLTRGGYLSMEGALELGTYMALIAYAISIFEPIQQLARIIADIVSAQASIERVTDLLEKEPGVTDSRDVTEKYGDIFSPKKENWESIKGDIEFKDVSFKYPDGEEMVLEHFNMKIPAGTTVAIVGETGAGKSTIVNLVCRFFEPVSGQILIDGVDYRERSQLWLHSNIGYVLQNPHLFSGTIRDNIRYGNLEACDSMIEEVAKQVSADTVVNRLEKGFDSDAGEGGDRLSTGEKQLISFARAVLADPRIFVLDEATSSIDTKTEKLIQDAIAHILKDRTSFIIAHRLSTIRHADVILVVKDGRIIEQGHHRELLSKRGYYYSLCSKQFEEEATAKILST